VKKKKDQEVHKESSGALLFLLTSLALSAAVAALFAVAGFLAFIPYGNLASAVLLAPAVCILLYTVLLKKTRLGPLPARVLTGISSLAGAYVYICVIMGALSGIFGQFPVETEIMRETEMMEYLHRIMVILGNAFQYMSYPGLLWQDFAAWNSEGWPMIAAAAFTAQTVLPQIFFRAPKSFT